MSLDIGKAFTFMFDDPDWLRKLGTATLVAFIGVLLAAPLIGLIPLIMLFGYTLDVTRNVLDGRERPLPEWEDWGRLFMRGLKLAVVFVVWALPFIVGAIPIGLGSALTNSQGSSANALGGLIAACGGCLTLLWSLVFLLFTPALYVRVAVTDEIAAGFDFGRLWAFTRDNLTNVIVAIIMALVAGLIAAVAALAGLIVLCVGILVSIPFAMVWHYLVQAHLYGQVGAASVTAVISA